MRDTMDTLAAAQIRDGGPKVTDEELSAETITRPANRRERRDFIRSQHRLHRLLYGFGQWRKNPGKFVTPARGDKA